jgi:tetratricopeptide (TPR) repeat protein
MTLRPPVFPDSAEAFTRAEPTLVSGSTLGAEARYRVIEPIGRGGFAAAYLSEDTQLTRLCLVKQLTASPTWSAAEREAVSQGFAREARLLVELNSPGHPNIPEIYAYLPTERCLVMKYIAGLNLRQLLQQRAAPLLEEEALRYIRDVCAALDYMHQHPAGLVLHRDLKPDNIMLDAVGRIWLIDFGLARSIPLTLVQASTLLEAAGTPGYSPPEQWRGAAGPKSDIYALAATLYELLSLHRPPRDPQALTPLRQLNPAASTAVEALIARCMALDPAARPDATLLLRMIDDLLAFANVPEPPIPARPPVPGDVVSRAALVKTVQQRLAQYGTATLTGMPGVGKTTLAAIIALQHSAVFWHRLRDGEGIETLIWRLAGWLVQRGQRQIWQQIQRAQLAGSAPPDSDLLAEQIARTPALQGALLCFDDIHHCRDEAALARVIAILRQACTPGGAAMLITTRKFASFISAAERIVLDGLSLAETRSLLERRSLTLAEDLLAVLHRETGGNAQLLTLAIEVLHRNPEPGAVISRLAGHDAIERYLLHEVDRQLTEEERQVMSAVAVLGAPGASYAALDALLDGMGVRRPLFDLHQRHLLVLDTTVAQGHYHQHAILHQFYFELLGRRERQVLQRRAARFFSEVERDLLLAARHFADADEPQQAAACLTAEPWAIIYRGQAALVDALAARLPLAPMDAAQRAALLTVRGEVALLLGKIATAQGCLSQAIAAAPAEEAAVRQARRYRLLAQAHERAGDYTTAEIACRQGLVLAETPGAARSEMTRLYAQFATVLMLRGDSAAASESCTIGLDLLPPAPAMPAERAALLQRLGALTGEQGKYPAAIEIFEQCLGLARQAGDTVLTASVLRNLGMCHYHSGQMAQARHYLRESLGLIEQVGSAVDRVKTLTFLGLVQMAHGDSAAALQLFAESRALAEQQQLPEQLADVLVNSGQLHYEAGDLVAARADLEGAAQVYAQLERQLPQAHCAYLLGDIALRLGWVADARAHGERASQLAYAVENDVYASCALRVIGEAQLAQQDIDAADATLTRAWELQAAIGDPYDQALILAAQAKLYAARAQPEAAAEYARRARDLAREQHIAYLVEELNLFLHALELGG